MNKGAKIFGILVAIVVVLIAGLAVAVSTFDINNYRDQIADALSKQTGRAVKFGGPIHLAISTHGIGVAAQDVSVGNPSWASRPEMASIGKLQLGVALAPLVEHKLVITRLDVDSANIQLETNASNQHNWDMQPAGASAAPASAPSAPSSSSGAVGVSVNELSITNSQLAMRDKDGKTSTVKVDKIALTPSGHGTEVTVKAEYNGSPVKLDLKTGAANLMAEAKWPFDADLAYANYQLKAQGSADTSAKSVDISSYDLTAGSSSLHGKLTANAGGAKTDVRGTVTADKLDLADFKPSSSGEQKTGTPNAAAPAGGSKQLFSTAPLDVSALKSADANIDVSIGELIVGKTSLKQVGGTLALANGDLALAPLKATAADSQIQASIKLEASSPPRYNLSFKAPGVDIASLLQMTGSQAFMSGKGDADIELSGAGASLHDMAAGTNGTIIITAADGKISAAAAGSVASGLAQILSPGTANPTLNCAAARFNVTNGVGKDNGILADSSASTVAGSGGFNLGAETVDMTLDAKPKLVNTQGLTPALRVTGPLASPNFGIDAASTAQNVAGTLLKNKLGNFGGLVGGGGGESAVPAMQTAPSGQNACVYTLDHKGAATAAAPSNSAVKNTSGSPAGNMKNLGNQLMKGLLGH